MEGGRKDWGGQATRLVFQSDINSLVLVQKLPDAYTGLWQSAMNDLFSVLLYEYPTTMEAFKDFINGLFPDHFIMRIHT